MIAEALGHGLVIEPYVNTVVVAGGLLDRAGGGPADALIEQIATGSAVVAVADTPLTASPPRVTATSGCCRAPRMSSPTHPWPLTC